MVYYRESRNRDSRHYREEHDDRYYRREREDRNHRDSRHHRENREDCDSRFPREERENRDSNQYLMERIMALEKTLAEERSKTQEVEKKVLVAKKGEDLAAQLMEKMYEEKAKIEAEKAKIEAQRKEKEEEALRLEQEALLAKAQAEERLRALELEREEKAKIEAQRKEKEEEALLAKAQAEERLRALELEREEKAKIEAQRKEKEEEARRLAQEALVAKAQAEERSKTVEEMRNLVEKKFSSETKSTGDSDTKSTLDRLTIALEQQAQFSKEQAQYSKEQAQYSKEQAQYSKEQVEVLKESNRIRIREGELNRQLVRDLARDERKDRLDYQQTLFLHHSQGNNQILPLSSEPEFTPSEIPPFGTRMNPMFRTRDLEGFTIGTVFPNLTMDKGQKLPKGVNSTYNRFRSSVRDTLRAMSVEREFEGRTEEFVEMRPFDEFMSRLENVPNSVTTEDRRINVSCLHRNLPCSHFYLCDQRMKNDQFESILEKDDRFFLSYKPLPEVPDEKKSASEFLQKEEEKVGTSEETPSSSRNLENSMKTSVMFLKNLMGYKVSPQEANPLGMHVMDVKKNLNLFLNILRNGMGIVRAFLIRLKSELATKASYQPIPLAQIYQDNVYARRNMTSTFNPKCPKKSDYMKAVGKNQFLCRTCGQVLSIQELSRGHITAKGKGGSDHLHNIEDQCKGCNVRLGDGHMMLHPKFYPVRVLPEL